MFDIGKTLDFERMKTKHLLFASEYILNQSVPIHFIYTTIIADISICITRTSKGVFAFENKCPHYSVPLESGKINFKGEIVCNLHAYRFDLKNGWETTGKKYCLKRYAVLIESDGVFIEFS